eukprot:m.65936 g.65936  ORF g.65936 m.65936 type:complete len:52 (+) comp7599_c0_seq4:357-512(+)
MVPSAGVLGGLMGTARRPKEPSSVATINMKNTTNFGPGRYFRNIPLKPIKL